MCAGIELTAVSAMVHNVIEVDVHSALFSPQISTPRPAPLPPRSVPTAASAAANASIRAKSWPWLSHSYRGIVASTAGTRVPSARKGANSDPATLRADGG